MQAVAIPTLAYDALGGAYRLDDSDLDPEDRTASGGPPALVAALWGAVQRTGTAEIMVLHHANRCWVAAGRLLMEGQKGLNIGFLMPTLRGEIGEVIATPLPDHVPGEVDRKVIWALATRMARVEAERVYHLDTGDVTPILVSQAGFALPGARVPQEIRSAVASAVQAGRAIRYSLGAATDADWGPVNPVAALFSDSLEGAEIRISDDLWPQSVPGTASLADVRLALCLVKALAPLDADPDVRLQVLGPGPRQVAVVTKLADVWAAKVLPSGVVR